MSPTWFFEESTPSIIRISKDCPAGMVTSPPGATLAAAGAGVAAGAGAGAAIEVAAPPRPVKVKATTSLVLKACTSPFTSKRTTAAVPPKYRPCITLPLFSSRVSAAATLAKNNPTAMAAKKRFKLRIPPSLLADSIPRGPNLPNGMPFGHSTALDTVRDGMVARRELRLAVLAVVGSHNRDRVENKRRHF